MTGKLIFEDGSVLSGKSFGGTQGKAGEVVFSTGMMGYPESLTDPSYKGQILTLTYPLIGNYGIPDKSLWESDTIMVSGLIVSHYIATPSHFQSQKSLGQWFQEENIPLLEIKDTRFLTQKIREQGAMLGRIEFGQPIAQYDPNIDNLVEHVSTKDITLHKAKNAVHRSKHKKIVILIDCGAKRNIQNALLKRGINVITVPWDFDPFAKENSTTLKTLAEEVQHTERMKGYSFDGIVISNGPGDPKMAKKTIVTIQKSMNARIPTLGICLGHQLLSLAAEGDTKKLKYGHRSQNQPCIMEGSKRCYITTQNHGFAVHEIPLGFKKWFTNANDGSNEGIIHAKFPFMSVQFHPEATPGPEDTEWIFDFFIERITK